MIPPTSSSKQVLTKPQRLGLNKKCRVFLSLERDIHKDSNKYNQ